MGRFLILLAIAAIAGGAQAQSSARRVSGRIHVCMPKGSGSWFEEGVQFYRAGETFTGADEVVVAAAFDLEAGKCADVDAYADIDDPAQKPQRDQLFERPLGYFDRQSLGVAKAKVLADFK